MAGNGELYQRRDGKWGFRVKAGNGRVVATDGGRAIVSRTSAGATLKKLMAGGYPGCEEFMRKDGTWGFRIKAANGQVVAYGSHAYATRSSCSSTSTKMLAGAYDGPIEEV